MEQLTTLDAGFLEAEDSDRHVSLAIGGLAVAEGPIPDDDSVFSGLADRIAAIPRYTQVLRVHPFDLGSTNWPANATPTSTGRTQNATARGSNHVGNLVRTP
jgi:diacylglycerol O-acyltransferase / wax synthase